MAYEKQNFADGQVLKAENLNHIEDGIVAAADAQSLGGVAAGSYALKTDVAPDSTMLGGKAPEYYLQPMNLLDNSDFSNPVNQRGSTSYSGSGYSIDRWYSNGSNQTVQVSGSYIKATATGTSYCGIRQKVGRMASLAGKTITFAAKVYSNVIPSIRFINASATTLAFKDGEKATTTTIVLTYTVPSDATMDTVIPIIIAKTAAVDDYINIYWAAIYEGVYTADTLPSYVPKDKHVEMLNCGVPLAPRNLLDNSNFRNPVNQRGATTYTGTLYTVDRWWLTAGTLKVNSNGVTLTSDASTACTILQFIDHISDGIYTFAAKVAGAVRTRVIQVSGTSVSTLDASNASYSIGYLAFQYNEHRSKFYSSITVNKGENRLFVEWAALYEGSYTADTLPPYVPKDFATELAECNRYYKVLNIYISPWLIEGANIRRYGISYDPMRIAPTATVSGLKEYATWTDLESTFNPYNSKSDRLLMSATKETSSTKVYAAGTLILSADL